MSQCCDNDSSSNCQPAFLHVPILNHCHQNQPILSSPPEREFKKGSVFLSYESVRKFTLENIMEAIR
ncbi:hypothetical protein R1flu_024423 [Riccia fluitans]|uniref:Uncharacterized protein n=1 Tax=Riccia fluitans TaxID=41844 RepID=A0ABD1XXW4_9MARC